MEHVTNIAYPQSAISIAYESEIMAHELSHHWWGDLMTCETQEDMWLNEGMASYSERMFLEWTYNYAKYLAEVKLIHDDLIKYVHLKEKGFRAISGVPFEYTYGDHVYKKGADVAHTLRTYMGDAAFFAGLKYVLQQKAYKNMNSLEFRNLLQTSSGQNLTDFFNNWVFNGGWPHFSIDSVKTTGTSVPYMHTVYVKQKLHGAPTLYSNVPLEITFMNSAWNKEIKNIVMSGATQSFTMQTTVLPVFIGMNVDSKISDAISSEYKIIKTTSTISYALGKASLIVSNKGADSSYIRIEHNLVKADAIKNNIHNFRLNTQHYWKIDGILSSGFVSKLRFNYDGNKNTSGISYLDTCLTTVNGDSLILLYRKNPSDDWKEVNSYTKFKSAAKTGFVTVDTFKLGEYVFANGKSSVLIGLNEKNKSSVEMEIFPNPASHQLTVNFINYKITSSHCIDIVDVQGKIVKHIQNISNENSITISDFSKAQYIVNLVDKNKVLSSKPIIIE
jgi:aminopeptidase N